MRFRLLLCLAVLLPQLSLLAQDSDFPTLDALAKLEIPALDYEDLARRFTSYNLAHAPPANPLDYQIGDRESFTLPINDQWTERSIPTELRGMTENVLIWVQESATFPRYQAQAIAERVEEGVLAPLNQLFQYSLPPGVDGDPRLIVVLMHQPEFWRPAFFDERHLRPRSLNSRSNQREMMVFNLAIGDEYELTDEYLIATIAHEYQHILLRHRDANEARWLNEALSSFAEHYTGSTYVAEWLGEGFMAAPNTGMTHLLLGENRWAKYGAGGLFALYLAGRFGDALLASLYAESLDGWPAIDKMLRESAGVSVDDVFADWVLANYFQDSGRGFGYRALDDVLPPIEPTETETLREFPALHGGSLPQYSSEYFAVHVGGGSKLSLQLTQPSEARLAQVSPHEGDYFYYAVTTDRSSSRLTRSLDVGASGEVWLEFRVWHDLAEHYEYGYVQVSADGGETWSVLPGNHTDGTSYYGLFYDNGYTGRSGRWRQERIDLSEYAPGNILIRFEVLVETVTSYNGLAIDDLRIGAINYHDGFEAPDEAWIEEGWIRSDNRLPQRTWLQVVQENDEGLHLSRHMMTSSGEVTIDVLPGVSQALVAISPIVPQTVLETEYALEVNLFDADGALMAAPRDCRVTTTAGLNFRDAPNGSKIGLVPQGTALWALDSSGDWFQVEYENERGWIHGDYVTEAGNCP